MPYSAEISRTNPSCFLFMIDQSYSMDEPWGVGEGRRRKAEGVADAINRLLQNLVIRCSKEEGIRDYYHVGVIGYGENVGPAFGAPPSVQQEVAAFEMDLDGDSDDNIDKPEAPKDKVVPPARGKDASEALKGRPMIPISEIGTHPKKVETRKQKDDDGTGGVVEREIQFPIWFEPRADGGTPMCQALAQAQGVLQGFLNEYPHCFPPIVINITDGEATDGDPTKVAQALREMKSDDGNVLLFNLHISDKQSAAVLYPGDSDNLPDSYAKQLFEMSSSLPDYMRSFALQESLPVEPGSRGFVFNADIVSVINFLDIGTRPSNLR